MGEVGNEMRRGIAIKERDEDDERVVYECMCVCMCVLLCSLCCVSSLLSASVLVAPLQSAHEALEQRIVVLNSQLAAQTRKGTEYEKIRKKIRETE